MIRFDCKRSGGMATDFVAEYSYTALPGETSSAASGLTTEPGFNPISFLPCATIFFIRSTSFPFRQSLLSHPEPGHDLAGEYIERHDEKIDRNHSKHCHADQ